MPSSHLILCHPLLLLPQSFPAPESFPMSQLFAWGGQSTGASALASFLPKKSQGWSSEWTGWIAWQTKGLSRVFSNTTVQTHQFFSTQPDSRTFRTHGIIPYQSPSVVPTATLLFTGGLKKQETRDCKGIKILLAICPSSYGSEDLLL